MDTNARIEKLKERRAQLSNRIARLRNVERAKERKRETRRKILVGAAVIAEAKKFPKTERWLRRMLARRLTRPRDRALFGLEPLPEDDE